MNLGDQIKQEIDQLVEALRLSVNCGIYDVVAEAQTVYFTALKEKGFNDDQAFQLLLNAGFDKFTASRG